MTGFARMTRDATLAVGQLQVDEVNPRETLDDDAVDKLAHAIKSRGLDEPLHVRPLGDGRYGVLSGQTRLAACMLAGVPIVPVIVHEDLTDQQAAVLALAANTARGELRPTEEARAVQRLVDTGMTQYQVAAACGISQPKVSNLLKLLDLDDDTRARVDAGEIGMSRAIAQERRRYANGHGVPRGKAAKRARRDGQVSAAHLTRKAAGTILGIPTRTVSTEIRAGRLEVDPVTEGVPLHALAAWLDEHRPTPTDPDREVEVETRTVTVGDPRVVAERDQLRHLLRGVLEALVEERPVDLGGAAAPEWVDQLLARIPRHTTTRDATGPVRPGHVRVDLPAGSWRLWVDHAHRNGCTPGELLDAAVDRLRRRRTR